MLFPFFWYTGISNYLILLIYMFDPSLKTQQLKATTVRQFRFSQHFAEQLKPFFLTIYRLAKSYWLLDGLYGLHLQGQAVELFTILHGLTQQKIQFLLLHGQSRTVVKTGISAE